MKKIALYALCTILIVVSANAQITKNARKVIDNKGSIGFSWDTSSIFVDTAHNGLTINRDSIMLGGKLNRITTIDINGQKIQFANLVSGNSGDSLLVSDPTTGEIKRISKSSLFSSLTGKNGLHREADSIKLGGALTEPTTITTDAVNVLKLTGLTSGLATDSLVVIDPSARRL